MSTLAIDSFINVLEECNDDMKRQVISVLTSIWSCEDVSKEKKSTVIHMFDIVRFDN